VFTLLALQPSNEPIIVRIIDPPPDIVFDPTLPGLDRRVTLHAVQRREQLLERLREQNLLEARIAARPSDVIVRNQIHGRYAGAIVPTILARKGC